MLILLKESEFFLGKRTGCVLLTCHTAELLLRRMCRLKMYANRRSSL